MQETRGTTNHTFLCLIVINVSMKAQEHLCSLPGDILVWKIILVLVFIRFGLIISISVLVSVFEINLVSITVSVLK